MDEIKISKIKLRRGTNAQRKSIIPDQGELIYTLDTQRLYVGNGVLSGGISPTSKIHPTLTNVQSLTSLNAETNDLVFADGVFYQLSGTNAAVLSSWANVGTRISPQFQYDNTNSLTIRLSSLSSANIDPNTISNGIKIENHILQMDINTKALNISSNKLQVKSSGIDEYEISSSTFTNGITGGSGNKVGLWIDPTQFYFNSGILSLSSVPSNSLTFASINSSWIGNGLIYDNINQKIKANLTDVDNSTIIKNISGVVGIAPGIIPQTIFDILTGKSTTNGSNSLSSIFNGNPQHTINGAIPGLATTKFTAISTNGITTQTIELTSAGFITYQGNVTTQNGQTVGRFGIPIFAF